MNSYEIIKKELKNLTGNGVAFSLSASKEVSHGDYSADALFVILKNLKGFKKVLFIAKIYLTNPYLLLKVNKNFRLVYGEYFKNKLEKRLDRSVEKIEVAGPGFINFFLKENAIRNQNNGREVSVEKFKGKNILVEHSSPNLFKPFHIGHLMNNIVGEFITRAMNAGGANIQTISFPSDISLGIAKAIYILEKDGGIKQEIFNKAHSSGTFEDQTKIVEYLGECYRRGVALAEENPELESEIKDIARKLYDEIDGGYKTNSSAYQTWSNVKSINTVYFEYVLESIGSKLGKPIFESEVAKEGKEIVLNNTGEGKVFSVGEKDAVIYVPSEDKKDINTSVFINSEGHPTYEAKDLALIKEKFTKDGKVDYSYFVTDAEQTQHFKIVLDAASKLGGNWLEWVEKSKHITHGRMLFKGQKMSSRLGNTPLALDVISVVEEEVREKAGDKIAHLSEEERKQLEREIALSALRIAVLRSKPGLNINFDPDTSLSFEGDSGPYLLYTHARCSSLLDKGGVTPAWGNLPVTSLEKALIHFEEVLEESITDLAPQKLVTYLFKVAQEFNSYYGNTQILVEGDEQGNAHRLMIVKRTKNVLAHSLRVLGIKAPERM